MNDKTRLHLAPVMMLDTGTTDQIDKDDAKDAFAGSVKSDPEKSEDNEKDRFDPRDMPNRNKWRVSSRDRR